MGSGDGSVSRHAEVAVDFEGHDLIWNFENKIAYEQLWHCRSVIKKIRQTYPRTEARQRTGWIDLCWKAVEFCVENPQVWMKSGLNYMLRIPKSLFEMTKAFWWWNTCQMEGGSWSNILHWTHAQCSKAEIKEVWEEQRDTGWTGWYLAGLEVISNKDFWRTG